MSPITAMLIVISGCTCSALAWSSLFEAVPVFFGILDKFDTTKIRKKISNAK